MDEPAPIPKTSWPDVLKNFSPATFVGIAGLVLFLVFCTIDTCIVRWWLMLPLAAAGSALFLWRRTRAAGAEARVCSAGLALLLALVVLRDVGLSRRLAGLFDQLTAYKTQVDQAGREINRFFGGKR